MRSPEQLKGWARNVAAEKHLRAQEILQMFMFERLLERLAASPYQKNFILKGGLLISSIVGLEGRTTMDMDTTVRGIQMEEEEIVAALKTILAVDVGDGIRFEYGCPFMQADCDALAPSDNLIIYGHNMKDGSMFADLAKYRSKDFWQSHKTVWFDTELGSSAYEIFAVIHTTVQADDADALPFYWFVDAAAPEDFADYVSACKAQALYDTGVSAQYGDKLLTLSTCDNITDNGRLLVIAKQTETE